MRVVSYLSQDKSLVPVLENGGGVHIVLALRYGTARFFTIYFFNPCFGYRMNFVG